ncbi:MAG: class I SAM-dependent methyltransferase [Niabella sp.]
MTEADKLLMFRNRLTKRYKHLSKTAKRSGVGCYKVYDHDLPEFPFLIQVYGDKLYVAEYKRNHRLDEEAHERWLRDSLAIMSVVLQISPENIFTKLRQRKAGRMGQYQKTDNTQNEFVVQENGLKFIVNLSDYLDTGLFLDHRVTRSMVMQQSKDKRVLNLFAYTGSFSVYAAAGKASQVTTVDLSNTYLKWAQRNMELNGFQGEHTRFVHADAIEYLKNIEPDSFDIIVMDPPTFSNSKRMDDFLDIQRDHVQLINNALKALSSNGLLYFSTNHTKFELDASAIHAADIKDITKATTPFDYEGTLKRWCYLITK